MELRPADGDTRRAAFANHHQLSLKLRIQRDIELPRPDTVGNLDCLRNAGHQVTPLEALYTQLGQIRAEEHGGSGSQQVRDWTGIVLQLIVKGVVPDRADFR